MIKIYNTIKRRKEEFSPITEGKIRMYMCGATVYNLIHFGNARPLIVFDVARRYLEYNGYDVTFVQNFTDVDDRIIAKANEEGVTQAEIASRYIKEALLDADNLNVKRADFYPLATEEISGIINMIQTLIDKQFAYEKNGSVFFDTSRKSDYGKLSGKNIEDLEAGARVEVDNEKRNPSDFVLWKPAKPGEPYWSSPWSEGRPGWHIECSVMAKKHLGKTIDIHCGGDDLMFPHHENEIAQSESANDVPFVNYWMHNAMILVDNVKMSKSLGNFFTLREVAEKFSYELIRFFMLSAHYRSPINFNETLMSAAKNSLDRIKNCAEELHYKSQNNILNEITDTEQKLLSETSKFKNMFEESMEDDFNTANAITAIFGLVKFINVNVNEQSSKLFAQSLLDKLRSLCEILGIDALRGNGKVIDEKKIEALIKKRQQARKTKDFVEADKIRDELLAMGIEIKDTREGVKWMIK